MHTRVPCLTCTVYCVYVVSSLALLRRFLEPSEHDAALDFRPDTEPAGHEDDVRHEQCAPLVVGQGLERGGIRALDVAEDELVPAMVESRAAWQQRVDSTEGIESRSSQGVYDWSVTMRSE